ncbi:MAG: helix-turn-helix domain-containing protein [Thermaerobacter sp.]|nr:helix-turn-helix domain-containing protein [Thermaerobacter sp.]
MKINFDVPDSLVSGLDAETLKNAMTFGVVVAVLLNRVADLTKGSALARTDQPGFASADARKAPQGRLLKMNEVATALNVSRATVYALRSRGKIKTLRVANALRVPQEELDRLLIEGVQDDPDPTSQ